jgi:hypothetical protein
MLMHRDKPWARCIVAVTIALSTIGLTSPASAELSGSFTPFRQCPYDNLEVNKCLFSVIDGGEVLLGSKRVPVTNPVTLQGGYGKPINGFSSLFAAKDGETLSQTPQPVPGGLAGVVPPKGSQPLVESITALFFENVITGVSATLELADSVSAVKVNENNFAGELGTALRIPVKVRLENPLLGPNCYIGSEETPMVWNLTSGKTNPPPPNQPLKGSAGFIKFLDEASNLVTRNVKLIDNSWAAPAARGCGGFLSFLVDPIVNRAAGLPAKAGTNTASLILDAHIAASLGVRLNEEEGS